MNQREEEKRTSIGGRLLLVYSLIVPLLVSISHLIPNERSRTMISMPIVTSIDTTRTIEPSNGDEKFTVYQITVRSSVNHTSHLVDRRYREFESLHTRLGANISLPPLPRKVLLHRRSSKLIEQRRQLLEVYLNEVLRRCQQQSIMPDDLARFLQLSNGDNEPENYRKDQQHQQQDDSNPVDDETKYVLEHAPCLAIIDHSPWNSQHREILVDSVLSGLMHAMYDM